VLDDGVLLLLLVAEPASHPSVCHVRPAWIEEKNPCSCSALNVSRTADATPPPANAESYYQVNVTATIMYLPYGNTEDVVLTWLTSLKLLPAFAEKMRA